VTGLEVEALAYLNRADEALQLVERSLTWAAEEGRTSTYIDLAVLGARVAEDVERFPVATRYLDLARDAADAQGDPIVHLACGVALLRVHRRSGRSATAKWRRLRDEVVAASQGLTRAQKARHPSLVRDLAAEIGDVRPELVVEAAKLVGVDIGGAAGRTLDNLLSSDDIDGFVSYVRENFDDPPPAAGSEPDTASPAADEPEPALQKAAAGQTAAEQGERVSRYLEEVGEGNSWNNALSEVFRGDADQAAFEL
jgi:cellulose synthase operon protein C